MVALAVASGIVQASPVRAKVLNFFITSSRFVSCLTNIFLAEISRLNC
jgi:hypothetical protein